MNLKTISYLLIFIFIISSEIYPQKQKIEDSAMIKYVDSLKQELTKCNNAEDSVYLLCRISWRTDGKLAHEKLRYGKLALQTSERIGDKIKISEAYDAAASGYWAINDIEKAKELYKKSLEVGERNNLSNRIGYSAYHLAQIAISENKFDSTFFYVNKSRHAFKKTGRNDMVLKNGWLLLKSNPDNRKNHIDTFINDMVKIAEVTHNPTDLLFHNLNISRLYGMLENKNQSMRYVQLAMDIADDIENQKGLTKAYYMIAAYLRDDQKNYETALTYYNKIYEIQENHNYKLGIADVYNEIGTVYKLMGNDSLALHYFKESLEIAENEKHRHYIANAYKNIGEINYIQKKYDEALDYYLKCYKTGCDYCPQITFHTALINMGNVYLNSKDYDNSLKYFEKALVLADSSNADYERAVSYSSLAKYYEVRNNLNESVSLYKTSLFYARSANSLLLQSEITNHLGRLYFHTKEFNKAYTYSELSKKLSDSLESISKVDNLAKLETRFEFQNLQMQKKLDRAKSEKEIGRQKLIRNFFIIGLILAGLLVFIIYLGYRRKKRDNRLLNEQKKAIEKMSKQVHEADLAKLQFFTNISHELRTPLTLIMGITEKLKITLKERQFVNGIRKNSLKLLQLINHLLDLRKLDTSKMNLMVTEGNISDFLKGIASSFEDYAKQKKVTIECISGDNEIIGYFDHDKLEKILSNLISNAIKYNHKNGQVKVSVTKEMNGYVKINIIDTGIGMTVNEIKNIYNRFYRVEENSSRGSGIGLALVKELVDLHKGEISVKSTKNEGTVFIVDIPIEKQYYSENEISQKEDEISSWNFAEVLDIEDEISTEILSDPNPDKQTLLIVEDNSDLRKFITDIFIKEYEILEASNGEEGFKLSQEYVPDIVISDIIMPKLSGIQLVEKIKNNVTTSHIPVILLTAKKDLGTRLSGFEKGADDYISKPFDSSILKSRVENLLRLRKHLVEKFSKQFHLEPKEITIENADQKFLEKTIKIIEKQISNPNLNVDLLAMELGVSRTQLYRKLKALTDYSANQFIRIIRLKRAAQILRQGQNNIAEVMDATGFSNYSYFNNCFKEYFGEFPKDYALLSVKGSMN